MTTGAVGVLTFGLMALLFLAAFFGIDSYTARRREIEEEWRRME